VCACVCVCLISHKIKLRLLISLHHGHMMMMHPIVDTLMRLLPRHSTAVGALLRGCCQPQQLLQLRLPTATRLVAAWLWTRSGQLLYKAHASNEEVQGSRRAREWLSNCVSNATIKTETVTQRRVMYLLRCSFGVIVRHPPCLRQAMSLTRTCLCRATHVEIGAEGSERE
jgi:hypothetical protein